MQNILYSSEIHSALDPTMHNLLIDSLSSTNFQIIPDQWIQEFHDSVRDQFGKDSTVDDLANHDNDNRPNSFVYLRDDEEKTSSETLWKESKIFLLVKNGEPHLDDNGEPVTMIKRSPKDNAYDDLLTYNGVADKSEISRIVLQEENSQHIFHLPDNDPDFFYCNYESSFDTKFYPGYYPSHNPISDPCPNPSLYFGWHPEVQFSTEE